MFIYFSPFLYQSISPVSVVVRMRKIKLGALLLSPLDISLHSFVLAREIEGRT
jgi:hypothetical protein